MQKHPGNSSSAPPGGLGIISKLAPVNLYASGVLACVQTAPLFRGITAGEASQLAAAARVHKYGKQQILFREDDPVDLVFVLESGHSKITRLSRGGKEVILRVDGGGDVLDLDSTASLHRVSAQALEACRVVTWEARSFAKLSEQMPIIARNAARILSERLHALEERFRDMATERVPQRLARILIRFFEQHTPTLPALAIALSCEELAQMVGTTQFTVSRLLCQWAAQGIIEPERKMVIIENLRALIELAGG